MRQTHHVPADVPQYFPFGYWSFLESTCEMSDAPGLLCSAMPRSTTRRFPGSCDGNLGAAQENASLLPSRRKRAAQIFQALFPCGGTSNASVHNHGPWTILFVPLKGVGNWGAPGHVCSSHTQNLRRRLPINIVSGYAILQIRDMILCLYMM